MEVIKWSRLWFEVRFGEKMFWKLKKIVRNKNLKIKKIDAANVDDLETLCCLPQNV